MTASSRADTQHNAALSLPPSVSEVRTQSLAEENCKSMQTAFQGWRAVVLHMAARRQQLQQAALASAERAIRKGCNAASESSVARHSDQNESILTEFEQPQLSSLEQQNRRDECVQPQDQRQQSSQDAADLTAAFFKASAHWSEKLQARVLHTWQEVSRQAIASLWQQHELKAAVNQQLLQVSKSAPASPCMKGLM